MLINEVIKLKPKSKKALDWIEKIYSQFPVMPSNNKQRAMVFGQGEDQALGVFELAPSMLVPDAVEIVWFQAYPTKSGIGKIAMQKLQDLASQDDITLTLYPWGKGVVPKAKLKKFYTAMGFKPLHKADMMIWTPDQLSEVTRITIGKDEWGPNAWSRSSGRPEKVRMLPVNRIKVHEPDTKFDKPEFRQYLERVKAALRRGEKIEPITVRRMPGEFLQYQVLDGHHRFKAYRDLGMKTIPAQIVAKFNITDLTENMTSNVNPKKNSFAIDLIIDGKSVGTFQYNQQTGRTIVELDPALQGKGLGKLLILQGIYTAAKLGMDYIEDESRTAAFDNAMDSLADSGFIVNDDEYWYVTDIGEKYLQNFNITDLSPEQLDENVEANPKFVYRIDSTKISDFGKNLRKYKHTADWSTSGLDQGDDWWNERGIKPETSSGIFAGTLHQVAPYATGNANQTRFVVAIRNNQKPILYFDIKDVPVFKNRKTYLTKFNGENFKLTPTEVGEYFSERPGNPVEQIEITNPFEFIRKQGWDIKLTKDLEKELEEIKKEKNVTWRAEGMN